MIKNTFEPMSSEPGYHPDGLYKMGDLQICATFNRHWPLVRNMESVNTVEIDYMALSQGRLHLKLVSTS